MLERELNELEKGSSMRKADDVTYLNEEMEDLSDRLDTVEKKSILDKIQVGGEFRTRLESHNYDDIVINGEKQDGETREIWSNRLRLNLKSQITDDIIFHGRLTWFKLWGDTNFDGVAKDFDHPSIPEDEGNLHVERAYIDYFIPNTPLCLTFGRLPTSEGPPNELKENTTRKATWPKLLNDGESDGIMANLSMNWTGLDGAMLRFAYAKLSQNYKEYTGLEFDDTRIYVGAAETELPGIKDSLFWLGYIRAQGVNAVTQIPGSTSLKVVDYPKSAGNWDFYNIHLQFNNIRNLGLDWFVSYTHLHIDNTSEGSKIATTMPDGSTAVVAEVGVYTDSMNGNLGKTRNGRCLFTGFRYRLPIRGLKFPTVGFEFNHGTKYWTGVTSRGGGDIINKINVNGEAYEAYYIQPVVEKRMFCRMGVVHLDHDYKNPSTVYGDQVESDLRLTQFYFLADVRF